MFVCSFISRDQIEHTNYVGNARDPLKSFGKVLPFSSTENTYLAAKVTLLVLCLLVRQTLPKFKMSTKKSGNLEE